MDDHLVLMGTVIEKVQSAKSGLNEAFTSLLTGFEVCDIICLAAFLVGRMFLYIDSSP